MTQSTFVDMLPDELLIKVFSTGARAPRTSQEVPFPLVASSINRHWRIVAITSPVVWSSFQIFSNDQDPVQLAKLWRERVGLHDLEITAHLDPPRSRRAQAPLGWSTSTMEQGRTLKECIAVLAELRSSWTRFTCLEGRGVPFHHSLFQFFTPDVSPRLKYLAIKCGTRPVETVFSDDLGTGTLLPELTHVRLQGQATITRRILQNVTTLDLYSLFATHEQFRDIVAAAPRLSTLILRKLHSPPGPARASPEIIAIPSLHSLALSFQWQSGTEFESLFSTVSLPNLKYLELEGDFFPPLNQYFHADTLEFSQLHVLRMCRPEVRFNNDELQLFSRFEDLRRLELIGRTEGEVRPLIVPQPTNIVRSRSIGRVARLNPFNNRDYRPQRTEAQMVLAPSFRKNDPSILWPKLTEITLHTRLQADARWLLGSLSQRLDSQSPILSVVLSDDAVQLVGSRLTRFTGQGLQVKHFEEIYGLINWEEE